MPVPATLETSRLILRQWRDADYAPFAEFSADPEAMRYFPHTLDRAASDAMIDRYRSLIDKCGWGFWAVATKAEGAFIGLAGLHVPSHDLPFLPCVEIGWRLLPAAWGRGYATEAARGALRYGFEELNLPEIVAFAAVSNAPSRKVMERLGMRFDSNFSHPALDAGSPLREHCLYRLPRECWRASRPDPA